MTNHHRLQDREREEARHIKIANSNDTVVVKDAVSRAWYKILSYIYNCLLQRLLRILILVLHYSIESWSLWCHWPRSTTLSLSPLIIQHDQLNFHRESQKLTRVQQMESVRKGEKKKYKTKKPWVDYSAQGASEGPCLRNKIGYYYDAKWVSIFSKHFNHQVPALYVALKLL